MWKYTFSIAMLVFASMAFGQEAPVEETRNPKSFRPHELKVGINAIRTGRTLLGSDVTSHEIQAALAIRQVILVADFGLEKNTHGSTYDYENTGSYYRVGIDQNFSKNKSSGTALSLGLRYARATFEDQLIFTSDQGFGEETFNLRNANLQARWLEVAFSLRGKIVDNLYTGFTMRWQFARKVNGEGQLKTHDIPGFGKTRRQNSTAFDYYFMWRIPFD